MNGSCSTAGLLRSGILLVAIWRLSWGGEAASAQPVPLPYRFRAPFLPTIDLLEGGSRGLILGAEEADRGRPAPVTIGPATFVPQVRRAGQVYGGYMQVSGDLQLLGGDVVLGNRAVGATLHQLQQSFDQLDGRMSSHTSQLQQQSGSIEALSQGATQAQQAIGNLGAITAQQSALLQQHDVALDGLRGEMREARQAISNLDQNLTGLGQGVAGATALTAALTSLPVDPDQSPLACGIGSGGYSDRYALAMGCSVSLAPALAFNAGAAYLFGGSSSYGSGSLSNLAGRFGFSYRFGGSLPQPAKTALLPQRFDQDLQRLRDDNRELRAMVLELRNRLGLMSLAPTQQRFTAAP